MWYSNKPMVKGTYRPPESVDPSEERKAQSVATIFAWAIVFGASVGLLVFELWLVEPLTSLVLGNSVSPGSRTVGIWIVLVSIILSATVAHIGMRINRERCIKWVMRLRPLSLVFLVPLLLSPTIWHAVPLLSLVIGIAFSIAMVWWLVPTTSILKKDERHVSRLIFVVLVAAMVGYAGFVAVETIHQHQLLETRAYDFGIMENVFWHTSQGRFFASSIEGRNHLGVHTSFIYLLFIPIYVLFPSPETLLILQAVVMALAAWPLFLLARHFLHSDKPSLLVSSLYLIHPAAQGANFYDFHELAFAPVLFFTAMYALFKERTTLLWGSVVFLLLVKEDCAFIVVAIGIVALLERRTRTGLSLLAAGGLGIILFQGFVIPHFAGGESSFAWYYTEMIPSGEGPAGLLKTLILNPFYSLRHALTVPKVLYVVQIVGPVLFLCLFGPRSLALVAYGLAISVFASREYLFVLGFQYSLQVLPQAYAGCLLTLSRAPAGGWYDFLGLTRKRALIVMTAVSLMLAFHHGMLSPVARFRSGFRIVDFRMDDQARERFQEVQQASHLIPPSASVTASETLVPHVAQRMHVQTLRYAADSFCRDYDYFFVLRSDLDAETVGRYSYVLNSPMYNLVREGRDTLLFRRTVLENGTPQ